MGVNRVDYAGDTLIDISQDTVTSEDMAEGISAHGADGEPVIGVAKKTWTGTKAQYEAEKNNITDGTIVNITDDADGFPSGGIIDVTDKFTVLSNRVNMSEMKAYKINNLVFVCGCLTLLSTLTISQTTLLKIDDLIKPKTLKLFDFIKESDSSVQVGQLMSANNNVNFLHNGINVGDKVHFNFFYKLGD